MSAPIFQGLGFAPGNTESEAWAVNADGSVVVGGSYASSQPFLYTAFEWTAATGAVGIDQSSTTTGRVQANGVSNDGSVIVGFDNNGAFRWTAATGAVSLGPGGAYDVSGDGAVVVGYGSGGAFRWTASTGRVSLGYLPGYTTSEAYGTNADGSVVVGGSGSSSGSQACEWTAATGMVGLGFLSGYDNSFAYGVSADGSVVVGFDWQERNGLQVNDEAFVWTASGGLTAIGPGLAYRANADGSVVVGYTEDHNGSQDAFRWTSATGMQSIRDILTAEGINLNGWTLSFATGVSADGQTIVGEGSSTGNYDEAWIATIPLNAFALLDLQGTDHSIGSLLWGGTVTNSGSSPATLTAGGDNTSTTFSGTIQNGSSTTALNKIGAGTLTLSKTNNYSGGTTISDGTLELASGASAGSGAIAFAGSGGVLKIDGATMPTNVINGFAPGDKIDLAGVPFDVHVPVLQIEINLNSGNVLQITDNGSSYNLAFDPSQNFSGEYFQLTSDGNGGTTIVENVFPPTITESLAHDTGSSSSDNLTSNPALVGSADPNAVIHFTIDGSPIAGTATADVTGTWNFTPTGLADGTHTILASETVGDIYKTFTVAGTFAASSTTPAASLSGTLTVDETTGKITAADLVAGSLPPFTNLVSQDVYSIGMWQAQFTAPAPVGNYELSLIFTTPITSDVSSIPNLDSLIGFNGGTIFGATDSVDYQGNSVLSNLTGSISPQTTDGTGWASLTFTLDSMVPAVTAIAETPPGSDLNVGKTVTITLSLSEAVTVTGTPTLALNDGGIATYDATATAALNDPTKLVFDYTVASSDINVTSLQVTSLNLPNSTTIQDGGGNNLNLSLSGLTQSGPQIDTTTPTPSSFTANPSNGTVFANQVVTITVSFSEKVTVTGTPTLSLNDNGIATYHSGSGTNALVFSYSVPVGQYTPNLAVTSFNLPNGATVKDGGGNNANLNSATVTFSGLQISGSVVDNWISSSSGNWTKVADWSSGIPNSNSDAVISKTGSYTVALSNADTAHSLSLNDTGAIVSDNTGGSLKLAGGGGTLAVTNGTFQLAGGSLQTGTISISGGGTILIANGNYTGSNALSETITDNGSIVDNTTAAITGNMSGTGTILAENKANLTIAGSLTGSERFTLTNSAHVFVANDISGTGSFTIANSAILEFGGADNELVTFASGSGGTVKFDQPLTQPLTTFTETISGLTPKDTIDLADLTFVPGKMKTTYVQQNSLTGALTVTNGTQSVTFELAGNFTNSKWTLSKDASGGTKVVDPPAPTPVNSSSGLDHVVALFNQYMAAGFPEQHGGSITTNALSQIMTNEQQFLAPPHHG